MNNQDIKAVIEESKKQTLMHVLAEIRRCIEYNYDLEIHYQQNEEKEVNRNLSLMYWARRQELLELKATIQSWLKEIV